MDNNKASHQLIINLKPFKVCLLIFTLFFYIYGINFTFLPLSTARVVLIFAWMFFLYDFFLKPSIVVDRSILTIILIFGIYIYWVILISGIHQLKDIVIFSNAVLLIFHAFLGGMFFAILFKKNNQSFQKIIFFLQLVITIQALFILVYFISWEFREFTFKYIPETGNIDHRQTLYRSRGLTHSSGATLSVLQSIGLLFTAYLLATLKYTKKRMGYLLFSFGLLVISLILTARTGLLMVPVALGYLFCGIILKKKVPKNILYFYILAPIVLLITILLFRHIYFIVDPEGARTYERLISWYIKEFYADGQFQSRTVNILYDHWFLPENTSTMLFGDPTTWSINRISSDIGIVRRFHGTGIIGLVVFYCLYIAVFCYMIMKSKYLLDKLLFVFLGLFLLIVEAKEPIISHLSISAIYLMLFAYLILNNSKSITEKLEHF